MPVLPHSHHLRIGRRSIQGQVYLVTCVTKERAPVFIDFALGRRVVAEMRRLHDAAIVRSLAWVLMPDHLHWLLHLRSGSLGQVMQRLKGRSAHAVNVLFGKQALVWQKGYHDHAIRREERLRRVARYVIANPLRAGLVRRIGDYPLWDAVWLVDDVLH